MPPQLLQAVDYCHQRGIVHRDLKMEVRTTPCGAVRAEGSSPAGRGEARASTPLPATERDRERGWHGDPHRYRGPPRKRPGHSLPRALTVDTKTSRLAPGTTGGPVDFGLGVAVDREHVKLKTFCGTFEYAAPEMIGKLG